jgi:hypothetical protein
MRAFMKGIFGKIGMRGIQIQVHDDGLPSCGEPKIMKIVTLPSRSGSRLAPGLSMCV